MFGGWFPSIFGRGRSEKERDEDEDSSDSPGPIVNKSSSKSRDGKKSASDAPEDNLLVEKWTVACLQSVMLPAHKELSGVFAPLPLLALYSISWMAATDEVRKYMKTACGIDKTSVKALSGLLSRVVPSLNKNSLMIYRALTTPDQIHTIDPIFTTKLEKRFGRRAIIPADRDKQRDYIRANTKRMILDCTPPSSTGLFGFAAACVAERWQAETRPHPDRPFALNARQRQLHECFEWRGAMKMTRETATDSCLLPFRDSALALVVVRPTERGGIVRLRRELTAKQLHATFKKLCEQTPVVSRVLLPRVELRTAESQLLPKWRLSGVLSERVRLRRKGGERVCPPFREITTGSSIRIDERGVNSAVEESTRQRSSSSTSSSSAHSYYSAAIDSSLDPNFNLRLDSPFLFFVVHVESMAPILAGTYAGSALITPYNHSVSASSVSKSSRSKSLARKSIEAIRRPLKSRRSTRKSSRNSTNSEREEKKSASDTEKEWHGVPKCEECEKRSKKSSKSSSAAQSTVQQHVPAAAATTPAATSVTVAPKQHKKASVRETLKETHRSTRSGVNQTIAAGRATTFAARDGLVQAASIGKQKIESGIDKTKQTAVRIAAKSSEKAKKAKSVVSSTAKSIGKKLNPVISSLTRSRSGSRSVEEEEGKTREMKTEKTAEETSTMAASESSSRRAEARAPDSTTISNSGSSSSRKAKTPARPTVAATPSSVTRRSCSKSSEAAAPAAKPKKAAAAAKPAEPTSSSFETTKASAKATGKEVARNVKKGLSKAKGSMKKLFGRMKKSSKKD